MNANESNTVELSDAELDNVAGGNIFSAAISEATVKGSDHSLQQHPGFSQAISLGMSR